MAKFSEGWCPKGIASVAEVVLMIFSLVTSVTTEAFPPWNGVSAIRDRSEEHTSELQSLMRISYAVFCLKKKKTTRQKRQKREKLSVYNNTQTRDSMKSQKKTDHT